MSCIAGRTLQSQQVLPRHRRASKKTPSKMNSALLGEREPAISVVLDQPLAKKDPGREAGWVNRLYNREASTPEYQELKFTLHRKLLDRINLEALSSMAGERVRAQVRTAVAQLVEAEKSPLSLVEKDHVIEEVLDEVFGLGPLEPLLQDPTISDIRSEEHTSELQSL